MFSYITVLSNWLLGYDRYKKIYSKNNISQSTFKNKFFILDQNQLHIGLNKAIQLLNKIENKEHLIIPNNKIIKINTIIHNPHKHIDNRGYFIDKNFINVHSVEIFSDNIWNKISIEDLNSIAFDTTNLIPYNKLKPITLSFLPVGYACQAKCKFCFSDSSISIENIKKISDFSSLEQWCILAKSQGANRFVITGGGEPSLFGIDNIINTLHISKKYFNKNIMISNGLFIDKNIHIISTLAENGLDILSLSLHHYDENKNFDIMQLNTKVIKNLQLIKQLQVKPIIRLVCVLQKNGIDSKEEIEKYINFALDNNISQICFKELYVASTNESLYSSSKENKYCIENQIPLQILIDYCEEKKLQQISILPWGSPIFRLYSNSKYIDIAAYTEPSVGWERSNGICRSWNYMSDESCYATLEDKNSLLEVTNYEL